MRIFPFLNRHSWYSGRADAYADGELLAAERTRFEAHLTDCDECQAIVTAASQLRTAIERLPEVEVPRSFRITPQMLAETPKAARAPATPLYLGLARAGAALSVAAFAVVFVVGALGSDSSSDQTASREAASTAGDADMSSAPESAYSDKAAEAEPTPQLAPATAGGGVSGSALIPAPPDAATPGSQSVNSAATPPAANDTGPVRAADTGTPAGDEALTSIGYAAAPNHASDEGPSKALLITGILAGIFVAALAALEVTRRARGA
ncbi:MAG: zf-HC2 domain-containing protein [Dehalococcoidia bacterium]